MNRAFYQGPEEGAAVTRGSSGEQKHPEVGALRRGGHVMKDLEGIPQTDPFSPGGGPYNKFSPPSLT